ncbi:TolC family protein, partial [Candidatus Auribacterota bacterium]
MILNKKFPKYFSFFFLTIIFLFSCISITEATNIPKLTNIEIIPKRGHTKIILYLSSKANYYISQLDTPPRLLIDFKIDVESKLPEKQTPNKGNIDSIRSYYLAKSSLKNEILLPLDAIVIEFKEMESYQANFVGNNIEIVVFFKTSFTDSPKRKKIAPEQISQAEELAETLEQKQKRINRLMEKGKSFYRSKNFTQAIETWEQALALDPDDPKIKAYVRRAEGKITQKELEKEPIKEVGKEKLSTVDDQIDNYFNKGKHLYRQKKYKEAIDAWNMLLKLDPKNPKPARYIKKAKEKIAEVKKKKKRKFEGEKKEATIEETTRVDMPKQLPEMLEEEFRKAKDKYQNISLKECVQIALKNNNELKISQEEVVLAYLKSEDARKVLLPKGNLKWNEVAGTTSGNKYRGRELTFEIQQPLFDGHKAENRYRQSKVNIIIAEKNYEKAKNDFMFEISEKYYVLANSQKILENLKNSFKKCKKALSLMKKRVELELSKPVDLLSIKSSYNDIYLKVASALNDLELAQLSLKQKMGIKPNANINVLTTPPIERMLDISFEECLELAYNHRQDLLVNELQVLYHMYAVKMAKGATDYKIDLNASCGFNDEAYINEPLRLEQEWYVGVKLTRPLGVNLIENNTISQDKVPSAGQTTSSRYTNNTFTMKLFQNNTQTPIAEATVGYHKAIKDYIKAKNTIFYEVREGIFNYKKAILKIENNRSSIALTKKELAISKVKAELAEVSPPDLLKIEIRLHNQITDFEQAVTDYYTQIAKINKLICINRYFDPISARKNVKWQKKRFLPKSDIVPKRWWQLWNKKEDDEISDIIDEYYDLDEEFDKLYHVEEKRPKYRFWQFWKKDNRWQEDIYPVKKIEPKDLEAQQWKNEKVKEKKKKIWQFWKKESKTKEEKPHSKKIEIASKKDITNKDSKTKWWKFWKQGKKEKQKELSLSKKIASPKKETKEEKRWKKAKKEKEEFKDYYVEQIKKHRLLQEEKELLNAM